MDLGLGEHSSAGANALDHGTDVMANGAAGQQHRAFTGVGGGFAGIAQADHKVAQFRGRDRELTVLRRANQGLDKSTLPLR